VELPFEKTVVGIDVDFEQLEHNDKLDSKIQGISKLTSFRRTRLTSSRVSNVPGAHAIS